MRYDIGFAFFTSIFVVALLQAPQSLLHWLLVLTFMVCAFTLLCHMVSFIYKYDDDVTEELLSDEDSGMEDENELPADDDSKQE